MVNPENMVLSSFHMSKKLTAAFLLAILTVLSLENILARGIWASCDAVAQSMTPPKASEPPFDKLELFAFFAAGPISDALKLL
jgi:hypothetical protein